MSVQKVDFLNSGVYLDTQKCLISPRKLGLQNSEACFFSGKKGSVEGFSVAGQEIDDLVNTALGGATASGMEMAV